ncbi:MAG: hypothetical protein K8J08_20815, partial [Thermoanaerobaculia bacterium]|nr:hypothetical protein [Thermoanaerobaculia bacterium]
PLQCGGTCRLSDATFVELDGDETGRLGRIAAAPQSPPADPYFGEYEIVGKGEAVCGEVVFRIGRMTGQVGSEVEATCVGTLADWSTVPGSPPLGLLPCQHRYKSGGGSSDSGGPVVRRLDSDHAELVGIHWGGSDSSDAFSPLSNIEAEIGQLAVTVSNELPEILITTPPTGTHVGSGALVPVHLEAAVFDFEQGDSCSGCSVSWASTEDGGLGVSPFAGGTAEVDATISGAAHTRVVTADAIDDLGATSWDFVVLHTDNEAPQVWIDWPVPWVSLWSGVPYTLQGSSFDSETFQALPCTALEWTINGAVPPAVNGCHPTVVFPNPGLHVVTLQGEDSFGAPDSVTIPIQLIAPPPDAPPVVTFLTPGPGSLVAPTTTTTLLVLVTAPGGEQNAITVDWTFESPKSLDPSGTVGLGGATVFSGNQTSQGIVPQNYLQGGCGSTAFSIRVTATDTGSQQVGEATLDLYAYGPPC